MASPKYRQTSSAPYAPSTPEEAIEAYRLGAQLMRELFADEPSPEGQDADKTPLDKAPDFSS